MISTKPTEVKASYVKASLKKVAQNDSLIPAFLTRFAFVFPKPSSKAVFEEITRASVYTNFIEMLHIDPSFILYSNFEKD